MFTVLTWNLNVGLAGHEDVAPVIRELNADLVLLQEVGEVWEAALRPALQDDYPHMLFEGEGAGGLAVLSRSPLSDAAVTESVVDWFPALRFTVDAPWGPMEAMNVHLVPPFTDGGRLLLGWWTRHDDRKREAQHHLSSGAVELMAGDFNANEHERALRWLRDEHSLRSVLPEHHPRAKTWRWPHLPAWRLDHVMVDDCLVAVDAEVFEVGPSDQWPVLVTLQNVDPEDNAACHPSAR